MIAVRFKEAAPRRREATRCIRVNSKMIVMLLGGSSGAGECLMRLSLP
jgi:2-phosphoglycerate kinase